MEYVPWKFDIPNYMTTDITDILLKSLKMSIKAIGNQGLWVMALVIAFGLIITIINNYVSHSDLVDKGVKKRSLSREIFEADFKRHKNNLIDDSVMHKEVSFMASHKFHKNHGNLEIESKMDKMDSNHVFHKKHSDMELRSMVDRADNNHSFHNKHSALETEARKDKLQANHAFHKKHMALEVRARVDSMEVGHAAEILFNEENPDAYGEKQDMYKERADAYYESRGIKNKGGKKK